MPSRPGWVLNGIDQVLRDMKSETIQGEPSRRMLAKWAGLVLRHAIAHAPHFQGHYRRSLASEVDPAPLPKYARVGSNLQTATGQTIVGAIEGGTGQLSDLPGGSRRRHWPPAHALDAWADKKRIPRRDGTGYLTGRDVAAIIGRRGGLRPRRVLRNAADAAEPKIAKLLDEMGAEMVTAFRAGGMPRPRP